MVHIFWYVDPSVVPKVVQKKQSWIHTLMGMDQYLYIPFLGDEHPFTSYFDVHQGNRVLTHPHIIPHSKLDHPQITTFRLCSKYRRRFWMLEPQTSANYSLRRRLEPQGLLLSASSHLVNVL